MRLLRSEFLRARSRRVVPMVIIGGLIGIVIGLGIAAAYNHKPSAEQVASAETQYQAAYQKCLAGKFLGPNQQIDARYSSIEEVCNAAVTPSLNAIMLRDVEMILEHISTFVILLGALLGASLGGADWTSNTMGTLLTWEPRRVRVFLERALVVAVVAFVVTLLLQIVFALIYWLVTVVRGVTGFLPPHLFGDVADTMLRVSAMAIAFALVAYVLAMIGRSTVSSLGVLFGYLILFEGVIAGFRPSIAGSLFVRAAVVVIGRQPILMEPKDFSGPGIPQPIVLMDVTKAWVVVAIYVLVLGAVSLVQFRRRDVT
jgi:ABC-type transport system involved in multi-copper enzyme maturation permease subunit